MLQVLWADVLLVSVSERGLKKNSATQYTAHHVQQPEVDTQDNEIFLIQQNPK